MLPRPTGLKGRLFSDARAMAEAIIYRYRCGIAWRDLPEVMWLHSVERQAPDGERGTY
jgi:transposase